MASRPLPVPDAVSAPYWSAAARHQLALPRCGQCGAWAMPPDVTCPTCHSLDPRFTFEPVAGGGKVRTWTVIRRSFLQGFDLPFLLVDVELDVQPDLRLIGRLLDGPETPLRLGDRVSFAFEDLAPDISVPAFRLEQQA